MEPILLRARGTKNSRSIAAYRSAGGYRAIAKALKMRDVIDKLWAQGAVPSPTPPAALEAQIRRETELNGKLLRAAGVGTN